MGPNDSPSHILLPHLTYTIPHLTTPSRILLTHYPTSSSHRPLAPSKRTLAPSEIPGFFLTLSPQSGAPSFPHICQLTLHTPHHPAQRHFPKIPLTYDLMSSFPSLPLYFICTHPQCCVPIQLPNMKRGPYFSQFHIQHTAWHMIGCPICF